MSGPVEDAASKYGRLRMLATGHLVDTLVMSDMDESPLISRHQHPLSRSKAVLRCRSTLPLIEQRHLNLIALLMVRISPQTLFLVLASR
jgi:hypothetical protein